MRHTLTTLVVLTLFLATLPTAMAVPGNGNGKGQDGDDGDDGGDGGCTSDCPNDAPSPSLPSGLPVRCSFSMLPLGVKCEPNWFRE